MIKNTPEYKLFLPPDHLAEKGRKNWNSKEADEYFDWLLSVKDKRVSNLLKKLEYNFSDNLKTDLDQIESKVALLLVTSPFSNFKNKTYELTNYGLAVAADVGLTIADLLLRNNSNLYWKVIKKPKSNLYFNLPTLFGFDALYFDPIGGLIIELKNLINNPAKSNSLFDIFSFWDSKAKAEFKKEKFDKRREKL